MRKPLIALGISSLILLVWYFNQNEPPKTNHNEQIENFIAEDSIVTTSVEVTKWEFEPKRELAIPSYLPEATILKKHGFTIGFSKKYKNAFWVAYILSCGETSGKIKRTNYFKEDEILGKYSPNTDDYYYSGYDKGHLIPAGDNTSDSLSMDDSFLMSNVTPQIPGFNRGIWKRLEAQTRDWACENDSLYVITGTVLKGGLDKIGKGKVSVPDYFYKSILLYKKDKQSIISFLIYQYTKDNDLSHFIITTDSLEKVLGFDLFPKLDDRIENKIEKDKNISDWELN